MLEPLGQVSDHCLNFNDRLLLYQQIDNQWTNLAFLENDRIAFLRFAGQAILLQHHHQ